MSRRCANFASIKSNALLAGRKIRSVFPETPYGKLFRAVVEQAMLDCNSNEDGARSMARHYLCGRMPHAELCGVDADYVRRIMRATGVDLQVER